MSQAVPFTKELAREYETLFAGATLRPERAGEVGWAVGRLTRPAAWSRYASVADRTGVPAHVVGILHCLEASLDFGCHLHNGDPLSGRTVRVPAGRPKEGRPPFAWEASAVDALGLEGLESWTDWSLGGTAYVFERYNGFGYRHLAPPMPSPYLWGATTVYKRGKFVADHRFDASAESKQCGAMALLRRMVDTGHASLAPSA